MFYSRGLGVGLNIFTGGGVSVEDLGIPAATRHPSTYYPRMPWYVKAWDGKIWLANGNASNASPDANSGSGMVSYNPATGTSTNEYTNSDEQISTFREIGGQLWAAGGDKDGGGSNQWLYKYASGAWSKYEVLPFPDHGYDLIEFDSKIFATGGTSTAGTAYSADGGSTWATTNNTGSAIPPVRWHIFYKFGSDLYVSGTNDGAFQFTSPATYAGGLYPYKWNGTQFARVNTNISPNYTSDYAMMARSEEVAGKLLYIVGSYRNQIQISPEQMYVATSGFASITQPTLDSGEVPYDLKMYSATAYVLTGKPDGGGNYTVRIRTTTDAAAFPILFEFTAPSFGLSFDILGGDFYIALGTSNGTSLTTGPSTVSTDTGRLYRVTL